MGGLVLQLTSAHASFTSTSICTVVICWSAVCFGFGYGYGHNWTSVTASLSATAETRKTGFDRSLVHGIHHKINKIISPVYFFRRHWLWPSLNGNDARETSNLSAKTTFCQ